MAFDHLANTNNGNAIKKIAETSSTLQGRTTNLPIYDLHLSKLVVAIGDVVSTVLGSIKANNMKDLEQGYRQKTDHDDRLGNLPVVPGAGVQYREYFVPGNKLPKAAFARLVADITNARLFITPTHYDVWIMDRTVSRELGNNAAIAPGQAGAQNPFFLIKTQL